MYRRKYVKRAGLLTQKKKTKEEFKMLKLLAKLAEKYAKVSTTECAYWYWHEPKMPTSLLK